jgi:hypothetical protein
MTPYSYRTAIACPYISIFYISYSSISGVGRIFLYFAVMYAYWQRTVTVSERENNVPLFWTCEQND